MAQTDSQTDKHGDYMTNSAQWGQLVKILKIVMLHLILKWCQIEVLKMHQQEMTL